MSSMSDLYAAAKEGAVQRIRPKIMTVCAILFGLLPIMWSPAWQTGADVMKRIAAPMIGGVITSAILELLIYGDSLSGGDALCRRTRATGSVAVTKMTPPSSNLESRGTMQKALVNRTGLASGWQACSPIVSRNCHDAHTCIPGFDGRRVCVVGLIEGVSDGCRGSQKGMWLLHRQSDLAVSPSPVG